MHTLQGGLIPNLSPRFRCTDDANACFVVSRLGWDFREYASESLRVSMRLAMGSEWRDARECPLCGTFGDCCDAGRLLPCVFPANKASRQRQYINSRLRCVRVGGRARDDRESSGTPQDKSTLELSKVQIGLEKQPKIQRTKCKYRYKASAGSARPRVSVSAAGGIAAAGDVAECLWVHANCALWSSEVFELERVMVNVRAAVSRGKNLKCTFCGLPGATTGCCGLSCKRNYHFRCAAPGKAVCASTPRVLRRRVAREARTKRRGGLSSPTYYSREIDETRRETSGLSNTNFSPQVGGVRVFCAECVEGSEALAFQAALHSV